MHTITVCSRCNADFMYHSADTHLSRDKKIVDEVGNNEVVEIVICQDCDFKEKWIHKEVKVKEDNPFEHLNKWKLFVVDIQEAKDFPITVQVGDTNSFEWFKEEELNILRV